MDTIVYIPQGELAFHPATKAQPKMSDAEFLALCDSVREHGIKDALEVDDESQVLDGRHRLRAARSVGLDKVPCVVRSGADAVTTVLVKILNRRHFTKGALAYLAEPLLNDAMSEAVARRSANLIAGNKAGRTSRQSTQSTVEKLSPLDALAERFGVGRDLLIQARKVAKLFAERDAEIFTWVQRADLVTDWEDSQVNDTTGTPWTVFASKYIAQHGLDSEVDQGSDAFPPESFRERWEPELFAGEIGLGGIIQAAAGVKSTKGKQRADKGNDEQTVFSYLDRAVERFASKTFEKWETLGPDHRVVICRNFSQGVDQWPAELRQATFVKLKALLGK